MKEASANFDLNNVVPFLMRLKPHIGSGFSDHEILQIQKTLESMDVNEEKIIEFSIIFEGHDTTLKIYMFMDDIKSPDIAFLGAPELADKIEEEMEKFLEGLEV